MLTVHLMRVDLEFKGLGFRHRATQRSGWRGAQHTCRLEAAAAHSSRSAHSATVLAVCSRINRALCSGDRPSSACFGQTAQQPRQDVVATLSVISPGCGRVCPVNNHMQAMSD